MTRRMSGADRRAQLLDVARDVVAAHGFSGLTIDRVAAGSGVTRTVVYQQFTDLAGLTVALLDRESAIAFAGLRSVDATGAGRLGSVDELGRGILAYLHAAPVSWRIILHPPDGAPPQARERLELGRRYARTIAARYLSTVAGGPVDPDGVPQRILLAAIEELARAHLDDPAAHPDDEVLGYLRSLVAWAAAAEADAATAG